MDRAVPRVLFADDDADVVEALRMLLGNAGFEAEGVRSPEAALDAVQRFDPDCVLIDLNYTRDTTSGREGLDLLSSLRRLDPRLPVLVMTAWGNVEGAVEAMRRGAKDYVQKPWDNERLVRTVATQVELGLAQRRGQRLAGANRYLNSAALKDFVAESSAMRSVVELMDRVGPSDANVLVSGEHGTGKEVVAHYLHEASARAGESFVAVNAGGFAEGVFESEMLGHVKGAFTDARSDRPGCFELADRGTLFLDEIANVPYRQQAVLLRVLETRLVQRVGSPKTRRVNVRVLSATNADIRAAVAEGTFREDLLYRLNTVEINLPPLRDRLEDIPILATRFLAREALRYDKPLDGFTDAAAAALLAHPWPGNVRELMHAVERAVLVSDGTKVASDDLGLRPATTGLRSLDSLTLADAERMLIETALTRHDGNVSKSAHDLGLSRAALYRKLERHRISLRDDG